MGRKRKPDNLLLLENTYRSDRHGDKNKKLKVDSKIPDMPEWLDEYAEKEWKRITKVLLNANMLTEADESILSQYCILHGELERAYTEEDNEGEIKRDFSASSHIQLRMCSLELGLTPSARSKIVVEPDEPDF